MRKLLFLAAVNGGLAVLLGAFAAHGLSARLAPDRLAVFDTGARYHLAHALAMGLAALAAKDSGRAVLAGWLFLAGIVLFCGSLYGLALTGLVALGYVTPLGGVAFVMGWGFLAAAALQRPQR